MNGDLFAIDVATKVAELQIDTVINAIQDGTLPLPAGYTSEAAVADLREAAHRLLP